MQGLDAGMDQERERQQMELEQKLATRKQMVE
jgi:hypothetical protein